ncbi:DNA-directed RNA polymerase [Stetteria hydrogenophila]
MYEFEEWVGVDPDSYYSGENVDRVVLETLRENMESTGSIEHGIFVAVLEAKVLGDGLLLYEDPKVYLLTRYKVLAYKPVNLEVVRGKVVDAREQGIFVNLGPVDGLVYRTQIMDERVELLPDRSGFRGVESGRIVSIDDVVRARIVQIGKESRRARLFRVGLTMRQPYLGREDWVREQVEKELGGGGAGAG